MAVDKYEIPNETIINSKSKEIPYKQERNTIYGINDEYEPINNIKGVLKDYNEGKLKFDSRYVKGTLTSIISLENKFILQSTSLDDSYVVPTSNDFDILIKGIEISSSLYTVSQSGSSVTVNFQSGSLDYNNFTLSDVVIFGKFL